MSRIEAFRSMTREEFLGNPKIVPYVSTPLTRVAATTNVLQFGDYRLEVGFYGGNAYDGQKLISCYFRQKVMRTHDRYLRRGIGLELVYQVTIHVGLPLAQQAIRSAAGQALFELVWARIRKELGGRNGEA